MMKKPLPTSCHFDRFAATGSSYPVLGALKWCKKNLGTISSYIFVVSQYWKNAHPMREPSRREIEGEQDHRGIRSLAPNPRLTLEASPRAVTQSWLDSTILWARSWITFRKFVDGSWETARRVSERSNSRNRFSSKTQSFFKNLQNRSKSFMKTWCEATHSKDVPHIILLRPSTNFQWFHFFWWWQFSSTIFSTGIYYDGRKIRNAFFMARKVVT